MILAEADYPFLEVVWSMLIFVGWLIWLWMMIVVISDVFRRHDASGFVKVAWCVFIIVLPFLGVFIYLIAQGKQMAERRVSDAQASRAAFDEYVRDVAASSGPTDQIAKAKELLDSGAIDQAEFDKIKARALAA